MHEYDKASRYMIKQDPAGFFRWLWWHADSPLFEGLGNAQFASG
jgi:hypothetical protein